jgi:hypothetical protein
MLEWEAILTEDNRQGLLAGLDGYGKPLVAIADYTRRHRKSETGTADPNAPPLIPAWERSRAIANFRTAHGREGSNQGGKLVMGHWWAIGAWENVLSKSGVAFLPFHFRGEGRLPVRDLAHVRPAAVRAARENLRDFVRQHFAGAP